NYWIGLSMMHTLFTLEHNSIAERLKAEHPDWTDDQLFDKARLVNAALTAKIHTTEWTPALLQHPALQIGMHANWWGIMGKRFKDRHPKFRNEIFTGIPGTKTEQGNADYSLTEEFDVVYRMHSLIPDD